MDRNSFKIKYESEKHIYDHWGKFVTDTIINKLKDKYDNTAYHEIIKIPPSYRVKETDSILEKAFVTKRNKYQDAYNEITDKVGARFVVLLRSHLDILQSIIENCEYWDYSLDRDFNDEKEKDPRVFDYQSLHYVVKSNQEIELENVTIPAFIPCELQIRTLLQHAYAEMTHDTIYKGNVRTKPEVHRTIAKSMALMETTDDLLLEAQKQINEASKYLDDWKSVIIGIFESEFKEVSYSERHLDMFIDMLLDLLSKHNTTELADFFSSRPFIFDKIKEKQNSDILFNSPVILMLYFLISQHKNLLYKSIDYDISILDDICSDLGVSTPN